MSYFEYLYRKTNRMLSRITIDPDVCHGKLTIRGSRLLVTTILELLAGGMTWNEIMDDPNSRT
jgi:uncharacterized protein (DUF433 family)